MSNKPKPFPLAQLDTTVDKQVLPCVAGIVNRVYQRREGVNSKGDWSVQDLEIESSDGVKVKVKVWGKAEMPRSNEGKIVTFFASEGKSLTGVFVHVDTYDGKTELQIRTTASAIMQFNDRPGGSVLTNPAPVDDTAPQSAAPPSNNQPPADPAPAKQEPDPVLDAKRELTKLANLHILATLTVEKVIAPKYREATGREMPEDRRGASVSSLIIAGERRGLHLHLPTKPLEI